MPSVSSFSWEIVRGQELVISVLAHFLPFCPLPSQFLKIFLCSWIRAAELGSARVTEALVVNELAARPSGSYRLDIVPTALLPSYNASVR